MERGLWHFRTDMNGWQHMLDRVNAKKSSLLGIQAKENLQNKKRPLGPLRWFLDCDLVSLLSPLVEPLFKILLDRDCRSFWSRNQKWHARRFFAYDTGKLWLDRPQADDNGWQRKGLFKIGWKDGLEIQTQQVTLTPYIQTDRIVWRWGASALLGERGQMLKFLNLGWVLF